MRVDDCIITVLGTNPGDEFPFLKKYHIICDMDQRLKIALLLICMLLLGSVLGFAPRDGRLSRHFSFFQAAYQDGDYHAAAEHLAAAAEFLPRRPELWEKAGFYAYRADDLETARNFLEEAHSRGVLSRRGVLTLGDIYREMNDADLALAIWAQEPDSPQAAKRRAELQQSLEMYPAAIQSWKSYLSLVDDADPGVHYSLGLLLTAVDPVDALPHLNRAAQAYPPADTLRRIIAEVVGQEPAYRLVVAGQGLASLNRWTLAAFAFENALDLRPDYAEAWAYWGEALQHIPEKDQEPLLALEHALELSPDSALPPMFLGTYWQRQGDHKQALEYFEKAADISPENPDVYVEMGRSEAVLGDLEHALKRYQEAIRIQPDSADYHRLLAQFCVDFHFRVKEEGLPAARRAVHLSADSPPSLLVMGRVLSEIGDIQNAKKFFIRALEQDPELSAAHLQLGITYLNLDQNDLAETHLEAVLQLDASPVLKNQAQAILSTLSP